MKAKRRIVLCLLAVCMMLGLDACGNSARMSSLEQQVFEQVNAERGNAGLQALKKSKGAEKMAEAKAGEMDTLGYFGHESPTQGDIVQQFSVWGGIDMPEHALGLGENLAVIRGHEPADVTADMIVQGWMQSEGHRANILHADFNEQAIVVRQGHDGQIYAVQALVQIP